MQQRKHHYLPNENTKNIVKSEKYEKFSTVVKNVSNSLTPIQVEVSNP